MEEEKKEEGGGGVWFSGGGGGSEGALFSRFAPVLRLLPPALNAAQVSRCPQGK